MLLFLLLVHSETVVLRVQVVQDFKPVLLADHVVAALRFDRAQSVVKRSVVHDVGLPEDRDWPEIAKFDFVEKGLVGNTPKQVTHWFVFFDMFV